MWEKVQGIRSINGRYKIDKGWLRIVWEMGKPKNFFKNIFIDYAITVVPLPPPLHSNLPTPSLPHSPLQFMSMGDTYKIFGFYISYTILNLPQSILYLPFMLLIPVPFPPFYPLHVTADNPPCDLHFCDSDPVLVVCLLFFVFRCGC